MDPENSSNLELPFHVPDTVYSLISFRKSTAPQNRQLDVLISNSQQQVNDLVGGVTI